MAEQEKTKNKYTEAIGRRKTSTARVRIIEASKANFVVNGKDAKEYFKTEGERRTDVRDTQPLQRLHRECVCA